MMEQFEPFLFKDKDAFNALGLSMRKSRVDKNKMRMAMVVKQERVTAMLQDEGGTTAICDDYWTTAICDDYGTTAMLATEEQAATTDEVLAEKPESSFKIETNLKETERENMHNSVSEIGNFRKFELITQYLKKFESLPDFQLFDVKSYIKTYDLKTLELLGHDFKSFFNNEWLYAAAVDIGMKIQCSKFNKFDYVSLNVYETQVLLGDINVTVDKTFITNIINRDIVFCPILENSHYSLFVIDFRHAVLYYLDSGKK